MERDYVINKEIYSSESIQRVWEETIIKAEAKQGGQQRQDNRESETPPETSDYMLGDKVHMLDNQDQRHPRIRLG